MKFAVVASLPVLGVSGRAMLEALRKGTTDPEVLSRGKLRKKTPELRRALQGCLGTYHRFLVGRILAHPDYLDEAIEECGQQIEELLRRDRGRHEPFPHGGTSGELERDVSGQQ